MRVQIFLAMSALLFPLTARSAAQQTALHLSMRDGTNKPITYDDLCKGDALNTLPCHAVTVTAENQTAQPLRIDWMSCPGTGIFFEFLTEDKWQRFPLANQMCYATGPEDVLIEAHSHHDFPMFLRWSTANIPNDNRTYILRANWILLPCKSRFGTEQAFCDADLTAQPPDFKDVVLLTSNPTHVAATAGSKH